MNGKKEFERKNGGKELFIIQTVGCNFKSLNLPMCQLAQGQDCPLRRKWDIPVCGDRNMFCYRRTKEFTLINKRT
ncbi:hypothetical protein NXU95_09095 [Phocaeicola vulgatus]|nr:hypothetical protein [Phocaeicola vulgatus]